ncbi:hypothetical protein Fcan01_24161 [Folsomia candida]|uniref:Uncharacterized protein n=1 Tax=Folsomia candida TaxID=158441 RepID=A0A226D820_FOLCA|nr:hypothetical protein Fcan01_24161 [Folsomia candida]
MFSVVKFLSDKSVSAVPSSWVNKSTSKCFWPPGLPGTVSKSIRTLTPPKSTWISHPIKLFNTADTLLEARELERKAVGAEVLDTTDAEDLVDVKRKVSKTLKRKRQSSTPPSSGDDEASSPLGNNDEQLNIPITNFRGNLFSQDELDSLSHPEEPSLNHNLAHVCVGQGSSTTVNPPRLPLADDIVESVGQNNPPIIDPISNTEATTPNRTLSQRVLDRRPLRANESFEETVIRMLVEIKSDVRDLLRRGNINQEDISTKYKDIPVELPVSSEDELGTLEQWILRNDTNRNLLVSYLAEFGGKTGAAEITRGVLKEFNNYSY